jgi:long-chain fatty acid transport protein
MQIKKLTALIALATVAGAAHATDGYFSHGYGMKAKGMGGAATAMADDTFGGANNPASMAFVGDRLDVGIDLFSPRRSASRDGSGGLDGSVDSDSKYFLIPEFGYNKMLNQNLSLGVSVYGNGGMNTNYRASFPGNMNLLGGDGKLGVNLMQLVIAPTAAYKITPDHAIGISPLIGYQIFKAYGLQAFSGFSSSPANLTNNGNDHSFGYGVRVGYQGKILPTLTLGAAYASKMNFNEFDKYQGLFAEQGGFDIPENYNLGVAWQASPQILVALDYQRINFSKVASVGNPVSNVFGCSPASLANCLGGDAGPGFGWDDANVWKLGAEYKYNNQWTFRAGYNHTDNPISGGDLGEVTLNILAPAVIKDHGTLGFTYTLASGGELTVAYMHAFKNDVSAADPIFGGTDNIKMYQNSIGIAYGMKM